MKIDKVGEYRTSNGQRAVINTIFSGRAYGCIMDGYWFVGSSFWCAEDGSHLTQSDMRIVSKWVAAKQHDDDLRLIVSQTLERLMALQRYAPVPELYLSMSPDIGGDWLDADDMMDAIEDLRRAMRDCTYQEKQQ